MAPLEQLPTTGGIKGIFEQKYPQSADDVYSQFGYFGRERCVDGEAHFLRVYLFWFLAKRYGVSSLQYQEFEPNRIAEGTSC